MSSELKLVNEHAFVVIDGVKGLFEVFPNGGAARWACDPWEDNAGNLVLRNKDSGSSLELRLCDAREICAEPLGDERRAARLTFRDAQVDGEIISYRVVVELELAADAPDIRVRIVELEASSPWSFVELVYPLRAFCLRSDEENGYLALPFLQGCIVPTEVIDPDFRAQYHPGTCGLNPRLVYHTAFSRGGGLTMPWYGARQGDDAFVAIVETPDDFHLDFHNQWAGENAQHFRLLGASPVWIPSMGTLRYPRVIRYTLLPKGDYVAMAKVFREHAKEIGHFKSLRQKIEENPEVEKALGAPTVAFQDIGVPAAEPEWAPLIDIVEDMRKLGIKRAFVNPWLGAMLYIGHVYDFVPRGDLNALREASRLARDSGYIFALYEDYLDFYEVSPGFDGTSIAARDSDQRPRRGGAWDPGTRSYIACTTTYLERAKRKVATTRELVNPNGNFPDTAACVPLMECYDANHPMNRTEDWQHRVAMFEYMHQQGLVVGSEGGHAWGVRGCDMLMGPMGTNYGVPVPLFNLVFHDAVICQWHHQWGYNVTHRIPQGVPAAMTQSGETSYGLDYVTKFLRDLLYGNSPMFGFFSYEEYYDHRDHLKESTEVVGGFHQTVALDEMVSHRFLSNDTLVQESTFSSGMRAQVNFGHRAHLTEDGTTIPPRGYRVTGPALELCGHFQVSLERPGR